MNLIRLAGQFPSPKEVSYGLQPTIYHLSKEQAKMGLKVNIICRRQRGQRSFEEIEGIRVHRVRGPYNLFMLTKILKLGQLKKVDVIHAHATSGFVYGLLRKIFAIKRGEKIFVGHAHGTTRGILHAWNRISQESKEKSIKRQFTLYKSIARETIIWRSADVVIANSNFLSREIASLYGVPKERIHVAYNGVDLQLFRPRDSRNSIFRELDLDSKSYLILYLGGFRPVKGPIYVLGALEKIYRKYTNIKLLVVGGKSPLDIQFQGRLLKSVQSLQEKGVLRKIGNIPHVKLPEYYSAADVVVVPSIYDAFPKVILEAMACNTPVIASAVGGIPEAVHHEETGLCVNPADPDDLAKAILRLKTDLNLRANLTANARKMVERQFAWKITAKRTLEVYKKLTGNN